MQLNRDTDLECNPNKYAEKHSVDFSERGAHFSGYQNFAIEPGAKRLEPLSDSLRVKDAIVSRFFTPRHMARRTVLDLGGNNGFFSFRALCAGATSAAVVEPDRECVLGLNRFRSHYPDVPIKAHEENIQRWEEPADVVLAFALMHWLYSCTSQMLSLEIAIEKLSCLARDFLLVEWVDPADPLIQSFHHTEVAAKPYTFDSFLSALKERFSSVELVGEISPTRRIFMASKGPIHNLSWAAPLLFPKESLISSTRLWTTNEVEFWSRVYAVDEWIYKQSSPALADRELSAMKLINHCCVVPGEIIDQDPTFQTIRFARANGITLDEFAAQSALSREQILKLSMRLLDVIAAMRSVHIVHRDLHPTNILVTGDADLRIIDFGWATVPGLPDLAPSTLGVSAILPASRSTLTIRPPEGSGDDLYALGQIILWLNVSRDPELEFLGEWLGNNDFRLRPHVDTARAAVQRLQESPWIQEGVLSQGPSDLEGAIAKLAASSLRKTALAQAEAATALRDLKNDRLERSQLEERLARAEERSTRAGEQQSQLRCDLSLERKAREQADARFLTLAQNLDAITRSRSWRFVQAYRKTRDLLLGRRRVSQVEKLRKAFGYWRKRGTRATWKKTMLTFRRGSSLSPNDSAAPPVAAPTEAAQYALWLERNQLGPKAFGRLCAASAKMGYRPLVSVLTPVYDIDEAWLRRCIESVLEQAYDHWELCLVDDGSTKPHVAKVLAEYAARDSRIRTARHEQNAGIIAASATALKMAKGEYVALLDHDDELSPDALFEIVAALQERQETDLIYSDEDKLDESGHRVEPFFKPDWSPNLLLSMNYVCHLAVVRRALFEKVGGFRSGFEGSQDHDLLLRVSESARHIVHVPKVLYHWRKVPCSTASELTAKPYAFESGRRAIAAALERRGLAGTVVMTSPGTYRYRVVYTIPVPQLVSIIIPTRDRVRLLRTCISSIEHKTTYSNYELIIIDNDSSDVDTLRYLEEIGKRHRVLAYHAPFNWSAINNFAVRYAKGQMLLFMNNDMEIIEPAWMEALIEHAQRPEVGAVGAKLLYPSGRLQHAGVVLGIGGVAGHAFKNLPDDDPGYFSFPQVVRELSAVTGACMMVRRDVFDQVGGFDEQLRVAFNDIDFCLKLRDAGKLVIYTPFSVLIHHESASRGALHPPEDEALMKRRWALALDNDPYYSPHLSREVEDYRLRIP